MPVFRVSGATGQAPTTAFFPPIPSQFNMLYPYHVDVTVVSNFKSVLDTGLNQANFASQWSLYNTSYQSGANALTVGFGANATAPDGTNTAIKLVETTTNSIHKIEAGIPIGCYQASSNTPAAPLFKLRFAFFAKAAERTRVALYVYVATAQPPTDGIKVVFDLANSQVAVAPAFIPGGLAQANGWTLDNATIVSWGGGWNLCFMDVIIGNAVFIAFSQVPKTLHPAIYLDNGSGMGAESTSYTGVAGSGVYLWRTNVLPSAAWKMTGQRVFFDDFNDPNTVDTGLTYAQGKNFYLQGACFLNINGDATKAHGFNWYPDDIGHLDSTAVSVANSLLTIQIPIGFNQHGPGPHTIITALPSGGSIVQPYDPASSAGAIGTQQSWTGFTFGPPFLQEFSLGYNYDTCNSHGSVAVWCDSAEFHSQPQLTTNQVPGNGACSLGAYSIELDFYETDPVNGNTAGGDFNKHMNPGPNLFTGNPNNGGPFLSFTQPGGSIPAIYGIPTWSPNLQYFSSGLPLTPGTTAYYIPDGNYYTCILTVNENVGGGPNPPPPSDPTHWSLAGTPASLKIPFINLNNQNVLATLCLPYTKEDRAGFMMQFSNGFYIPNSAQVYSPELNAMNGGFQTEPAQVMHAYIDNNNNCHLYQILSGFGTFPPMSYSWDWFSYKK